MVYIDKKPKNRLFIGNFIYFQSILRTMSFSPEDWLRHHNDAYKRIWHSFESWLEKKQLSWQEVLEKEPKEMRNLVEQYLTEIAPKLTTRSLKTYYAVVRSFFTYNDIVLPKVRFNLLGGKQLNIARLTPDIMRELILAGKLRDRSFLIFKFQSLQDNERMLWINKNAWPQLKSQLDEGGWRDRNGGLWENVLRIDIPLERKGNPRPYSCFVGKDSVDSLRKHLNVQRDFNLIWKGLNAKSSMMGMMVRLCRRIGVVSREIPKTKGIRYGFNLHEMRDVSKSLWHESGADLNVWKFCAGQTVDPLGYDKIYTLSPDFAVKEFKKAEPYLNIISKTQGSIESDQRIKELEKRMKQMEYVIAKKVYVKDE